MGKLFGTDGIRGVANVELTAQLAFRVGAAAAQVLSGDGGKAAPLFVLGKDTRISSDLLEGALVAGLCSAGANVMLAGVVPTPAVAWMTVQRQADAGIVISASHNPFEHNGIKIFDSGGYKLRDELEREIESIVLSGRAPELKTRGAVGRTFAAGRGEDYIRYLAGTVQGDLAGLRVLVDCANGAAAATAGALFSQFPRLRADLINDRPDGLNINAGCGSTDMSGLSKGVTAGGYDLGIAFDGDADRMLAVDETGELIDGDQIMAVCAEAMKQQGRLAGGAVVATVMSNLGLHLFARSAGIRLVCTDVGDRHVLEKMMECGYVLGGEQSGHMIFLEHATTGDGQLAALQLLDILARSGEKASRLSARCRRFPQVLINVPLTGRTSKKAVMDAAALQNAIEEEETRLGETGRVLVRPSGTEALIRVMVEGESEAIATACAEKLANFIKNI